jgi:hypothetical protein
LHRLGDQRVRLAQRHLVGREPRQQAIRRAGCDSAASPVPGRQGARVLLELADAEQLGAQRLLVAGGGGGAAVRRTDPAQQRKTDALEAREQRS